MLLAAPEEVRKGQKHPLEDLRARDGDGDSAGRPNASRGSPPNKSTQPQFRSREQANRQGGQASRLHGWRNGRSASLRATLRALFEQSLCDCSSDGQPLAGVAARQLTLLSTQGHRRDYFSRDYFSCQSLRPQRPASHRRPRHGTAKRFGPTHW